MNDLMPAVRPLLCFFDTLEQLTHLDRQDGLDITLAQRLILIDKLNQDYQAVMDPDNPHCPGHAAKYYRTLPGRDNAVAPQAWMAIKQDDDEALRALLVRGGVSLSVDQLRRMQRNRWLSALWGKKQFQVWQSVLCAEVVQRMIVKQLLKKSARMLRALVHPERRTWSYRVGFVIPVLCFGVASALRTLGFVSAVLLLFSLPLPAVLIISISLACIACLSDLGFAEPILMRVQQIGFLLRDFYQSIRKNRDWKQAGMLFFFFISSVSFSVLMGGLVILGVTQMHFFQALPAVLIGALAIVLGGVNAMVNVILMTYALFNWAKKNSTDKEAASSIGVWPLSLCALVAGISGIMILLRVVTPALFAQWLPGVLGALPVLVCTLLFSGVALVALLLAGLLRCLVFRGVQIDKKTIAKEALLLFFSGLVCFSTWRLCVQGGLVLIQAGLPIGGAYALQVLGLMSTFCFVYLMIKRVWARQPWEGVTVLFQRAYQHSFPGKPKSMAKYSCAALLVMLYAMAVLLTKLGSPSCHAADKVYGWYLLHMQPQWQVSTTWTAKAKQLLWLLKIMCYGVLSLFYYGQWQPQGLETAVKLHGLLVKHPAASYPGARVLKVMGFCLIMPFLAVKNILLHVIRVLITLLLDYLYVLNATIAALSASFTVALSQQWAILPFSGVGGFMSSYAKSADNTDDIALLGIWKTAYRWLWPYSPLDSIVATQPLYVSPNSVLRWCYLTESDLQHIPSEEGLALLMATA